MSQAVARQPEVAFLQQPSSVRTLEREARDDLVVTYRQVNGEFVVLSRYMDDEWVLNRRTTNTNKASTQLRFKAISEPFRDSVKAVFYRYIRHGRTGVKPPSTNTVVRTLAYIPHFLRHLERLGISRFADVTPLACASYVQHCKSVPAGLKGKPLSSATLLQRFLVVELLHELSHFTLDAMPTHPWPDTSATRLAGFDGIGSEARFGVGKTPLMPDEVFTTLFQRAWSLVEKGDALLDLRDQLDLIQAEREQRGQHVSTIAAAKKVAVESYGISGGLEPFNDAIRSLRTACYIVLASLSGCRNHELAFVRSNAWSLKVDDEGNETHWMHSTSTKTGAGATQWMIPEAAVRALKLMTRWAAPYQSLMWAELAKRREANPTDPEIAELEQHVGAVFLGVVENAGGQVRTLSVAAWNRSLKRFAAAECGLKWDLATHQFRRKFANYAARSKFGDLRYLREHFKHWSMDMTLGYALNGQIEMELYLDVEAEYDSLKEETAAAWLRPDVRLSGGYGKNLMSWRSAEPITLFKNHADLVRSIAESTSIKSNGHAWCTADDGLCVGNDLEPTRCSRCDRAVISAEHKHVYEGLRNHLLEVLRCDDIGASGRARVNRDLERCSSVLKDLSRDESVSS